MAESLHKRKIQPNITERRIRCTSSYSALPQVEKEMPVKTTDDLLTKPKPKSKEGLISLEVKTEEKKTQPQKRKSASAKFFDAGVSIDAGTMIEKPLKKDKKEERKWVNDVSQPYAPSILPLPPKTSEENLAKTFIREQNKVETKQELLLMQFPRVLPISSKESVETKECGDSFDLFKKLSGKIGKIS